MTRALIVLAPIALLATGASAQPRRVEVSGDACDAKALADDVAQLDGEAFDASATASVLVELVAPFSGRDGEVGGDVLVAP